MKRAIWLAGLSLSLVSCGYHIAGHADLLPKEIRTIAVPAFGNATTRYKLADRLTGSVTREFLTRTRYNIVADPAVADATLSGVLVNYFAYPTVFDQATGRASAIQAIVILQINFTDRAGKVLYSRPTFALRERSEIAVDSAAYFDESEMAMARLSGDVARTVVSSILEDF